MAENRILVSRIQSMNMPGTLDEVSRAHGSFVEDLSPREAASNLRAAFNG